MFERFNKSISCLILIFSFIQNLSFAEIIKSIEINGNERIPSETIVMFANVSVGQNVQPLDTNKILKNIYESNFFENVTINLSDNILRINVSEFPIIENISYEGIKAKKIKDKVFENLILKPRSSFNKFFLNEDQKKINNSLKELGYFFSKVTVSMIELENNKIDLIYKVDLGEKSKIKKIKFIGNKVFKDRKLKSLITSEEYKFWKFISGSKYLNQNLINFDERLLKNFYLNKGYYNVDVNSSFAKLVGDEEFELIFNINANDKIFFNNVNLNIPNDFNLNNFKELQNYFIEIKGKPYSINKVNKILDKLDKITLNEEYKSINANVDEQINKNLLDLNFNIVETEKLFVEKINIFGNNITIESVIRNNLEIDEGDPFNEILQKKSENNLRSLNFFKSVSSNITSGSTPNNKIINIKVEEKPTGEISAGAGFGTSGGTFAFGIKENNYLGKGLALDANFTATSESFKGLLGIENPNFNNTDKSLFGNIQSTEIDRMKTNGYKTNKTGFELGTSFEYYEDLRLGLSTRTFYEKLETDSTASTRQQAQEGNYFDTFFNSRFDYDKRNQKFKPDDGFRSVYSLDLPIISDTYTLTNSYSYQKYSSFFDNNISSFSFYFENANSLKGDDIKLTERLFVPSKKLRGFEKGKVGPKDGNDFIGGNYAAAVNFTTTLPLIFENTETLDASIYLDIANIWGVDYDSSIDDSDKIRSSIGIGIDWFTLIGPINFSLSEHITKADTDITESFRFNIGTTF